MKQRRWYTRDMEGKSVLRNRDGRWSVSYLESQESQLGFFTYDFISSHEISYLNTDNSQIYVHIAVCELLWTKISFWYSFILWHENGCVLLLIVGLLKMFHLNQIKYWSGFPTFSERYHLSGGFHGIYTFHCSLLSFF